MIPIFPESTFTQVSRLLNHRSSHSSRSSHNSRSSHSSRSHRSRFPLFCALSILLFTLPYPDLSAKQQRSPDSTQKTPAGTYEQILQRTEAGEPTFSTILIPGSGTETIVFTSYRIPYRSLSFIRFRGDEDASGVSTTGTDMREPSGEKIVDTTLQENLQDNAESIDSTAVAATTETATSTTTASPSQDLAHAAKNQPDEDLSNQDESNLDESNQDQPREQYRTLFGIELDLFEGSYKEGRGEKREINGPSVLRQTQIDTVIAESYEQTRDPGITLQGAIVTQLQPGDYHGEIRYGQAKSNRKRSRPLFNVTIPDPEKSNEPHVLLLSSAIHDSLPSEVHWDLSLLNYGNSVLYRKPFVLAFVLPDSIARDDLTVTIDRTMRSDAKTPRPSIQPDPSDPAEPVDPSLQLQVSPQTEPLFTQSLSGYERHKLRFQEIMHAGEDLTIRMTTASTHSTPSNPTPSNPTTTNLTSSNLKPSNLARQPNTNSHTWIFVPVDATSFPNTGLQITLHQTETDLAKPLLTQKVQSLWQTMPLSLFNLDLSIDMLRFILPEETVKSMKEGSFSEKERAFREFWAKQDPTPKTEYNELMTEYYRRIDQSYEKFTTFGMRGFDTDRGRTWILMGPPEKIDRTYPADQPTLERWTYPNREYLFEAVSGFGDFRLVNSNAVNEQNKGSE